MPSFAPSSPESPFPGTGDFGAGVKSHPSSHLRSQQRALAMVSGSCTTMLRGRVSWTPEMALPELTSTRPWSCTTARRGRGRRACWTCRSWPWWRHASSARPPPFGRIGACATVPADGAMPYPYGMPSFAPSSPESYGMPSFAPSSPESPFPGTGDFGTGVAAALDTYRTTVDAGRTSKPAPSNFVNAPHFAARAKPAGAAGSFGTAAGVGVVGVGVVEAGALHAPPPPPPLHRRAGIGRHGARAGPLAGRGLP